MQGDGGRAGYGTEDGSKIRWEISTDLGSDGIEQLFLDNASRFPGMVDIQVVKVAQQTIL